MSVRRLPPSHPPSEAPTPPLAPCGRGRCCSRRDSPGWAGSPWGCSAAWATDLPPSALASLAGVGKRPQAIGHESSAGLPVGVLDRRQWSPLSPWRGVQWSCGRAGTAVGGSPSAPYARVPVPVCAPVLCAACWVDFRANKSYYICIYIYI